MGAFKVVFGEYGMILHQESDVANDSRFVQDLGAMCEHTLHPCVARQDENLWVCFLFILRATMLHLLNRSQHGLL